MMQAILPAGADLYQSFHRLLLFDSGVFNSWGGDNSNFVYSSNPWFERGGNSNNGSNAGVFASNNNNGNNNTNIGFRVALLAVPQYACTSTNSWPDYVNTYGYEDLLPRVQIGILVVGMIPCPDNINTAIGNVNLVATYIAKTRRYHHSYDSTTLFTLAV